MMTTRMKLTLLAGAILLAGSAGSARADWVASFDNPTSGLTLTPNTLGADSSGAIATYLSNVVGCSGCVTVSTGVAVAWKYNGDGHVVGPTGSSLTLGNSTGAKDNSVAPSPYGTNPADYYISNTAAAADGTSPRKLSDGIVITFTKGVKLNGFFSFDFQIFPDGTCPDFIGTDCGTSMNPTANQPDLTFSSDGAATRTWLGVTPAADGGSSQSPASGTAVGAVERAPQLIGNSITAIPTIGTTGLITLTNATTLSFMDWPETIGIDNLKYTAAPEPRGEVFLLAGLALVALAGKRLRRTLAKSSPEA